jgi:hypothetical protein
VLGQRRAREILGVAGGDRGGHGEDGGSHQRCQ